MAYVKKDTSNLILITSIDEIVQLSKEHKAIYVHHMKRWLPAKSLTNMLVRVVVDYVECKQLFKDNTNN